jgi:YD repeat-containing protein
MFGVVTNGSTYTSLPITHFYNRGQLLSQTLYRKESTGSFKKVTEDTYTYNTPSFNTQVKRAGLLVRKNIVRIGLIDFLGTMVPSQVRTENDWAFHNIYYNTDDNYITSSTKTVYNANDESKFVTTTTTYFYSNTNAIHQQPTTITTTNSNGETIVTEMRYPADYIATGGTTTNNTVLDAMLTNNMQAYPVEQWTYKSQPQPNQPPVEWVKSGSLNLYKQISGGFIVLDKQKRLGIASPINNFLKATVSSGVLQPDSRYQTMINYLLYDSWGNVLEIQKENDIKETYLWGYHEQYPVAKIIGSDYNTASQYINQSILTEPPTNDDNTFRNHLNQLRINLPNSLISTYTYKPLIGMTSETDARGRTKYYLYDNAGRLSFIRDHDNNIVKKFCYNYAGEPEDCCSSTIANWRTISTTCETSGGQNTGNEIAYQIDVNPCSPTWNTNSYSQPYLNIAACPLPSPPNGGGGNCCSGARKRYVNNICETGVKVYTSEVTYHFEFSDGFWSEDYNDGNDPVDPCIEINN